MRLISVMTVSIFILGGILTGACATAPEPDPEAAEAVTTPPSAPSASTSQGPPPQVPLPETLWIVGEGDVGVPIYRKLKEEGIDVKGTFNGRQSGIQTFCKGNADGLALSSDLDDAERKTCRELGGGWSALSDNEGRILYVRYAISKDLLERSTSF